MKVLMFHFVRPLPDVHYPELKSRSVTELVQQVRYVVDSGEHVWSIPELLERTSSGGNVPDDGWLLTFDDGLRDHRAYVMDVLCNEGIKGAFFVPGYPIVEEKTLRVQKIQIIFASGCPSAEVLATTQNFLSERLSKDAFHACLASVSAGVAAFRSPDDRVTAQAKYLLQNALPARDMAVLIDKLLESANCAVDPDLHANLYLSPGEVVELSQAGHFVGLHGMMHERYASMGDDEAQKDVALSIAALEEIGIDCSQTAIAYPYGSVPEASVLRSLKDLGVQIGFTTKARSAIPDDDWLQLPRWDTNDFFPTPRYGY
jgi:peptidoglycan/xylan/chitin deacetylase (PgdA/CDA1 family)